MPVTCERDDPVEGWAKGLADDQFSVTVNYGNVFLSETHSNPTRKPEECSHIAGQELRLTRTK